MKCIVVDDDELSRLVVKQCVSRVDFLEIVGEFSSAVEASKGIRDLDVDVIFLDIEMPEMSGLEFIRNLKDIPQVVIISSKSDYAAEAFDFNVTDYIVKPVNFARFLKAAEKARDVQESVQIGPGGDQREDFFIKVDSRLVKVSTSDIDYIEAQADYVTIHLESGKRYTILSTMKAMESKLSAKNFCRVHRSYIINLDHILEIEENMVAVGEKKKILPISRSYKENLMVRLNLL